MFEYNGALPPSADTEGPSHLNTTNHPHPHHVWPFPFPNLNSYLQGIGDPISDSIRGKEAALNLKFAC